MEEEVAGSFGHTLQRFGITCGCRFVYTSSFTFCSMSDDALLTMDLSVLVSNEL